MTVSNAGVLPSISLTAPALGATVSGSITVTAQAQSSFGIASVQFMLDGSNLGAAVTGSGSSYSTTWVSDNVANGTHSVAAVATDTQGGRATPIPVSVTVSRSVITPAAVFVHNDTSTIGNWTGFYGSDGSLIPFNSTSVPGYGTVNRSSTALGYGWTPTGTTDPRALRKEGSTTDRIASTYYSASEFSIDINIADNSQHQLALYLNYWDHGNRSEVITILNAQTRRWVPRRLLPDQEEAAFGTGDNLFD